MDQKNKVSRLAIQKIFVGFSQVVVGAGVVVESLQSQDDLFTVYIASFRTHKIGIHKRNIKIKRH